MRKLIFFLFLLSTFTVAARQPIDSLLLELDKTLAGSTRYEEEKLRRINLIKEGLQKGMPQEEEYRINRQLYQEYEAYICDSARHYINRNMAIATRLGNKEWLDEAKLCKAHILSTSGLYAEGIKLLESIDKTHLPERLLPDYYTAFENIYLYLAEYAQDDEYMGEYLQKMKTYRDSVLLVVPEGSYQYVLVKGPLLVDMHQLKEAEAILKSALEKATPDTRSYAILTSILAFAYQYDNEPELRREYLIRSAIADIRAVVKENNSLRALAELLYEEGQLERADGYMKRSMGDANFYNARLRNVQASRMLPVIDRAYQLEKEKQRQRLQISLIVISVLSVFLIGAVFYVIRQVKKVARARREVVEANKELHKLNAELIEANRRQLLTNNSLTEANQIKEEYIGRFLGQCSAYIDKLEGYRRMLNKKAASGKVEELYKTLKSSQFIEEELKEFYLNFDNSFLSLYPDFVECFNRLLPEEERMVPRQGERLTTELRIFALIRLGITDSAKIAGFLRYSITTIYTYRSKLKNKSLHRDNFEEQVMKIGTFKA